MRSDSPTNSRRAAFAAAQIEASRKEYLVRCIVKARVALKNVGKLKAVKS